MPAESTESLVTRISIRKIGLAVLLRISRQDLYISSHDMYFCGKTVPLAGIGVVSTLPEYRHRHCASSILIKSVEVLRDRGFVFAALAPFSYPFYRKYGWELAFHNKRYTISINELRGMGAGKGEFRPMKSDDIDNLIKDMGTSFQNTMAR